MSKFKFKAKPFKKELFQTKSLNEEKESVVVKMELEENVEMIEPIVEIRESLEAENPISKTLNPDIVLKPASLQRGRNPISNLKLNRSKSIERTSSTKENLAPLNFLQEKSKEEKDEKFVFKARPMPEFGLKEVKRSTNNLTIPNPPKLSTTVKKSLDKKI